MYTHLITFIGIITGLAVTKILESLAALSSLTSDTVIPLLWTVTLGLWFVYYWYGLAAYRGSRRLLSGDLGAFFLSLTIPIVLFLMIMISIDALNAGEDITKKFLYHHLVFFTLLSLCLALLIVIAVFLLDEPKFGIPNIVRFSGIIIAVVAGFVSSKFFHTIFAIAAPIISLVVMELDKRHIEKREQSGVT